MKLFRQAMLLGLFLALFAGPALSAKAQTSNYSLGSQKPLPSPPKKPSPGPFHGKLAAINKTSKTITVGKRTFQITPETKIQKAGQPATLDDAVLGEPVSGYVKPDENGKWIARSVNLGPKAQKPQRKETKQ